MTPSARLAHGLRRHAVPARLAWLCLYACVGFCATAGGQPSWPAAAVDARRLASPDREPDQWLTQGRDPAGTYHSPLADINDTNVARLGFAWEYRFGTHRGLEATPLVIDGVLYTTGNFSVVHAIDAATGAARWTYDPGVDGQWGRYTCCDAVNRGVAAWKGRIYVAALDGYLHAIDAATGRRVWKSDTLPARGPGAPYTLTGVPLIAGNQVIVGAGGGDFHGVRGYVAAFDLDTGRLRWRFYTVPRDPAQGAQDQPHLTEALKTWDPRHRWETGAGGAVWDGMAYDPVLKLIYIGTGNAAPYDIHEGGRAGGDNLYTDSILALHESGRLAWHFQVVPGDQWDFDSTQKLILADLAIEGRHREVLMQASKNGFFYVLDRVTGQFLSAKPYAFANWTKGLDPKSGRPIPNPDADYANAPRLISPWEGGAHSWQPMSFDPKSNRVFIPVMEAPDVQIEASRHPAGLVEGQFTSPIIAVEDYDPTALSRLYGTLPPLESLAAGLPAPVGHGFLRAWDPVRQRLLWETPTADYWNGGVLSTDGKLVIQGDITGRLNFYAATTGALLESIDVGSSIMAAPITYRVGGVQYVAVMAGYGGGQIGVAFPENSAAHRYGNEGRLIVLKLDGGAVPLPPEAVSTPMPMPPTREGTPAEVERGEILYNRFCSRCHVFGPGVLPDLRRLSPEKHALFYDIVLKGILAPVGMGRFDDVLKFADVQAIHAYLVDEAWKASAAPAPTSPEGAPPTLQKWQSPVSALPIVERIKVPAGPAWLGIGYGSVWLSKSESKVVLRIDPRTNSVVASIPVGSDPELGIGIGLSSVWIADTKDHSLTQIDPKTDRVIRTLRVDIADDPEGSIGVGEGSVWMMTNDHGTDSGTLTRIDAATGKVLASIQVHPKSHAVLVAYGSVWVTSAGENTVTRIDPRRNTVSAEISVHSLPRFMAAGEGSLWVLSQGDGVLSRIDPQTNRVIATVNVGVPGEGGDLAIAEGFVWVSAEGIPVSQIDPRSNRLVRQYVGGRKDDTLRVGFGAAWVVDEDNGEIWRIDLRALARKTSIGDPR